MKIQRFLGACFNWILKNNLRKSEPKISIQSYSSMKLSLSSFIITALNYLPTCVVGMMQRVKTKETSEKIRGEMGSDAGRRRLFLCGM